MTPLVDTWGHSHAISNMSFTADIPLAICSMAQNCGTSYNSTSLAQWPQVGNKDVQKWDKIQQQFKDLNLQSRKGLTLVVQVSKTIKILYLDVNISRPWDRRKRGTRPKKKRVKKLKKRIIEDATCMIGALSGYLLDRSALDHHSLNQESHTTTWPTLAVRRTSNGVVLGPLLWKTGEHINGQPKHPGITMSVLVSGLRATASFQPLPNMSCSLYTNIFSIHSSVMHYVVLLLGRQTNSWTGYSITWYHSAASPNSFSFYFFFIASLLPLGIVTFIIT